MGAWGEYWGVPHDHNLCGPVFSWWRVVNGSHCISHTDISVLKGGSHIPYAIEVFQAEVLSKLLNGISFAYIKPSKSHTVQIPMEYIYI